MSQLFYIEFIYLFILFIFKCQNKQNFDIRANKYFKNKSNFASVLFDGETNVPQCFPYFLCITFDLMVAVSK